MTRQFHFFSHYVGASTKDMSVCDTLFMCDYSSRELFQQAMENPNLDHMTSGGPVGQMGPEGRTTCNAVGKAVFNPRAKLSEFFWQFGIKKFTLDT